MRATRISSRLSPLDKLTSRGRERPGSRFRHTGRVKDGIPVDPDGDDQCAGFRDALHLSKLVDRFAQNLRRAAGFDVQYFAAVQPQKRQTCTRQKLRLRVIKIV
ncbi:MAG: replication initiation protein [Sphaerisporangium sp.]|nr:replication initiation protein [Sphaerisporangium sp.]